MSSFRNILDMYVQNSVKNVRFLSLHFVYCRFPWIELHAFLELFLKYFYD